MAESGIVEGWANVVVWSDRRIEENILELSSISSAYLLSKDERMSFEESKEILVLSLISSAYLRPYFTDATAVFLVKCAASLCKVLIIVSDYMTVSKKCLKSVWKVFEKCLKSVWKVSEKCLKSVWKVFEKYIRTPINCIRLHFTMCKQCCGKLVKKTAPKTGRERGRG